MFSYTIYAIKFVYEKKNGNLIFYFTLRIEKILSPGDHKSNIEEYK